MVSRYECLFGKLYSDIDILAQHLLSSQKALLHPIFTDEGTKDYGRSFGNAIHDMPPLWSGRASIAAVQCKLRNHKYKPSRDHYNSRQRCGEELVLLIRMCFGAHRSPTKQEVEKIVHRARQVHYVTERENQKARPYMAKQMSPPRAYRAAGIKLKSNTQDLFSKRGRKTIEWKKEMQRKYS